MKTITFDNLPAGSIVLVKRYNLWQKLKAWISRKELKYTDCYIDTFGGSYFMFPRSIWNRYDIHSFIPKKKYSRKEIDKLANIVFNAILDNSDEIEQLLRINLIRPDTFKGVTFEELLEGNKYYFKKEIA